MESREFFNTYFNRKIVPEISTIFTMGTDGLELDLNGGKDYLNSLLRQPIAGVVALSHTGRGYYINDTERQKWLSLVKKNCELHHKKLIVGVTSFEQAKSAKLLGADALLVISPFALFEKNLEYYLSICQVGLPVCISLPCNDSGVYKLFTIEELEQLFEINQIGAIKCGPINNFEMYEDIVTNLCAKFPRIFLFSGENRMFGESIEKIQDLQILFEHTIHIGAIVGLGQALTYLQSFFISCFDDPLCAVDISHAKALLSAFSREIFVRPVNESGEPLYTAPLEPYVKNMLYAVIKQYRLNERNLIDLIEHPLEAETRSIPKNVVSAVDNQLTQQRRTNIYIILQKGLEFELYLKEKYGPLESKKK